MRMLGIRVIKNEINLLLKIPEIREHQKVGGLAGLEKVLNDVDPDNEAGIVSPAEHAQKYFMQVADFQVVGNGDNP
jgi:hypothetical protein